MDDVYAPFVIHYVLNNQLEAYKSGEPSIYKTLELAGVNGGKQETENALNEMVDFQKAAYKQIEKKRSELISPILDQEREVLSAIDKSYESVIYANSTITGYLQSVRKVKEAQQEAISMIGFGGADTLMTKNLIKFSDQISDAVKKK